MKIILVLLSIIPYAYLSFAPLICADAANHPCKRKCVEGQTMRCCYEMTIEWMVGNEPNCLNCLNGTYSDCFNSQCMPIDGDSRLITVYNRTFPGPSIEVCLNDEVFVSITNELIDVTTSIHWHGMHQRGTQYMDGVPYITQCPIQPYTTFQYHFFARQVGTHFYHSHSSVQKANGAFGHLVVRPPDSENEILSRIPYDFDLSEHTISVTDWYNDFPLWYLYAYIRRREVQSNETSTLVVNGFGPQPGNNVPPRRFFVTQGRKYRFRVIQAGAAVCPIEVSIDNHKLIVVSTDGEDIEPVIVDSFYLSNGERFDFILDANQSVSTYTMRFTGYLNCNKSTIAALVYQGAPTTVVSFENPNLNPNRLSVNCFNSPANRPNCISYTALRSLIPMENILSTSNTFNIFRYYVFFGIESFIHADLHGIGEENLATPHLNLITMDFPPTPLLVQPFSDEYCNRENKQICNQSELICRCVHHVNLPWQKVIELILVDEKGLVEEVHPIHLHGQTFRVIAQDRLGNSTTVEEVQALNLAGGITRNYDRPVLKDTVAVPSGGYTVIRFFTDNPGMWLMHCHVDYHIEEGMQMVFQVNDPLWLQWPQPPPGFTETNRCGDYYAIY